jgi:hypothetical protein
MLKPFLRQLRKYDLHYQRFEMIDLKTLGSRKKISLFEGLSVDKKFTALFFIDQKSRFLQKNVQELDILMQKLITLQEHNYYQKILFLHAPLCSKAKTLLIENHWKIFHDFV